MAKWRHIFLWLGLFSALTLNAQKAVKHSITADVSAQALVGYNNTYRWYGGLDLKGNLTVDNVKFALSCEAISKGVYSFGLTVTPSFELCDNGFLFFDGTLHSRIFSVYSTYEFVYAGSVGFRMRHFSVQAGLFSRTIDAFGRDWHSLQNYVTEPFNLLYRVQLSLKGFDHAWDVYAIVANYNDYEYERMWEPIFTLGGRWDFMDKWSAVAEGTLEPAGVFHGTVKFYEALMRLGIVYKL